VSYEERPRIRGQFVRVEKLMAQNFRECFQMFLAIPRDPGGCSYAGLKRSSSS